MGLMGNAMKEKESLVQMLAMTAILGLSVRCLDHKYRIRQLQKETTALRHTQVSLTRRIKSIKRALLREASLHSLFPTTTTTLNTALSSL
ncbi:hypothetical protein HN51_038606 [Arachis hypogaea]|nr:uncharacterized protein DS421_16g524910 [Arachis hypogaea]